MKKIPTQRTREIMNTKLQDDAHELSVRQNIVQTAVGDHCQVYMEPVEDEKTGNVFHKIVILPKGG